MRMAVRGGSLRLGGLAPAISLAEACMAACSIRCSVRCGLEVLKFLQERGIALHIVDLGGESITTQGHIGKLILRPRPDARLPPCTCETVPSCAMLRNTRVVPRYFRTDSH